MTNPQGQLSLSSFRSR